MGVAVIARIAVWEPMPTDDRDALAVAVSRVPGVVAGFHLIDPLTGNGLSISVFEDEQAMAATRAAIEGVARELGWHEQVRPAPTSVTMYEVMRRM